MTFTDVEGRPIEQGARMRLAHNGVEWTSRDLDDVRGQPTGFLIVRVHEAGAPETVAVLVPSGRGVDREAVRAVLACQVRFPRAGGTTGAPLACRRLILDSALADDDTVLVPDRGRTVIEIPTVELTGSYLFETVVADCSTPETGSLT